MAQRLVRIRDQQLYRRDDYESFRAFVDGELSCTVRTAYNYVSVIELFGEELAGAVPTLQYSWLIKTLPVMRALPPGRHADRARKRLVRTVVTRDRDALRREIDALRRKVAPDSAANAEAKEQRPDDERDGDRTGEIEAFRERLPAAPSSRERAALQRLFERLFELLEK